MSRRREAAELAHALALSTQQARDLWEVSPHSLSSGITGTTQDSKELELRTVGMGPIITTARPEESMLFASARVDDRDVLNSGAIHTFTSSLNTEAALESVTDPSHVGGFREAPLQADNVSRDSPALSRLSAIGPSSRHSNGRPLFSPTQTSERVAPLNRPSTYKRQRASPDRTPLQPREGNRAFQLSSSPASPRDDNQKRSALAAVQISSPTSCIEVETTARPFESTTAARNKLYPEIVLPSKAPTPSRHESPDPLDSLPQCVTPIAGLPRSSQGASVPSTIMSADISVSPHRPSVEPGRRSSRVQAATEKKAAEKEERRRLRRERKAKEEEEKARLARSIPSSSDSARKRKSSQPEVVSNVIRPLPFGSEDGTVRHGVDREIGKRNASSKKSVSVPNMGDGTAASTQGGKAKVAADTVSIVREASTTRLNASQVLRQSPPALGEANQSRIGQVEQDQVPARSAEAIVPTKVADPIAVADVDGCVELAHQTLSPRTRHSPGPSRLDGSLARPGGIRWQTSRTDLSSVLAKFPGSRLTGMSKRHRIAPLHSKIGPPAKALPPVPQKPEKKKKSEDSEDEDENGVHDEEDDSGDEGGQKKRKKGRGIEWYMEED